MASDPPVSRRRQEDASLYFGGGVMIMANALIGTNPWVSGPVFLGVGLMLRFTDWPPRHIWLLVMVLGLVGLVAFSM